MCVISSRRRRARAGQWRQMRKEQAFGLPLTKILSRSICLGFRRFQPQISVSISLETLINKCICINGGKNRSQKEINESTTSTPLLIFKASQQEKCYFIYMCTCLFFIERDSTGVQHFFNLFTLPERPGLHWSNLSLCICLLLAPTQILIIRAGWGQEVIQYNNELLSNALHYIGTEKFIAWHLAMRKYAAGTAKIWFLKSSLACSP